MWEGEVRGCEQGRGWTEELPDDDDDVGAQTGS